MYRWTTSTPIPLPNLSRSTGTRCYSTIIGTNIWMIIFFRDTDGTSQNCMFVMDTDTNKIYNIENNHEILGSDIAQCFTSDGPNLYMICPTGDEDEQVEYTIFVMDTTKQDLEWHKHLVFTYYNHIENCLIIGKTLYLLAINAIELIVIDLCHKNPKKVIPVMNEDTIACEVILMKNNDTLYISVQEDVRRTVLILENDTELRVVKENIDTYNHDACMFVENGNRVLYKQKVSKSIDLETYDFANNDWTRTNVESTARNIRLRTALEFDEKIYVIVRTNWHDGHQHDIRVLDLKPNLSNICWFNLVDESISRGNIDQLHDIRNQLPDFLKSQIDSVVDWRLTEKEKDEAHELLRNRYTQMLQKVNQMCSDGEISKIQRTILIYVFQMEDLTYFDYQEMGDDDEMDDDDEDSEIDDDDEDSEMDDDDEDSEIDDDDEIFDDEEMEDSDMEE